MDDAELVRTARAGSTSALPTIFDRYAERVHDLALAMLRDRPAALEVVEATFLEARRRLEGLTEGRRLAVWLLAVTRHQAVLRAGITAGSDRQLAQPEDDGQRVRAAGLVWEAVADLPLLDRTMLDLALRHGMDGLDLVDALGVTRSRSQELEGRVRDIDKDLSGYLLAHLSGYLVAHSDDGGCPELNKLVMGWDGRFSSKGPQRLSRHIEVCSECTRASEALPPPLSLYAAIPIATYPAEARDRVRDRLALPDTAAAGPAVLPLPPTPPPLPSEPDDPKSVASAAFTQAAPATPTARPGDRPSSGTVVVLKLLHDPPADRRPAAGRSARAGPKLAPPPRSTADSPSPALVPPGGSPTDRRDPGSPGPVAPEPPATGDATAPWGTSEAWLPNGFPPLSFPSPEGASTRTPASGGGRGRWLAAAAILTAVLLLVGALLTAGTDNQKAALELETTSTSAPDDATTLPEATAVPGGIDPPLVPNTPSYTAPGGAGTARQVAPTTVPSAATPASLTVGVISVRLPNVDSTAGPQRSTVPLRNTGGTRLTYGTRSSFAGLAVDKPTGTIGPATTTQLTITLDGTKAGEGPFTGTLTFDGSGGTQQVTVTSTIGRPPAMRDDAGSRCTAGPTPCPKLVQLVPGSNPDPNPTACNTPWRYSITVEDESRLRSVRAEANLAGKDADLRKDGFTSGTGGRWQSDVFPPLPVATSLDVTIKAVDEFDFSRFMTERAIIC